jgi:hypothetical protein
MPVPQEARSAKAVKRVVVETIAHAMQSYDTVGDYRFDERSGTLTIYVSRTADWRESMTVAVHELVEALLCLQRGVPLTGPGSVDEWDLRFTGDCDEPGEARGAPYYCEHLTATVVERLVAYELGLHWLEYENHLYALGAAAQPAEPADDRAKLVAHLIATPVAVPNDLVVNDVPAEYERGASPTIALERRGDGMPLQPRRP